jgi:uncharacterized protein (DUF697 family)
MAGQSGAPPTPLPSQSPPERRGLFDAGRWASGIVGYVVDRIEAADAAGAARSVTALRRRHPDWDDERLVAHLIERKARQTAMIGAATTGGALIPGLGTLVALTVGVAADIGATVKLHAELVLEIATVHGQELTPDERRRIVGIVMGISAAESQLIASGIRRFGVRAAEEYGTRWLARAVPVLGVVTSAGANALSTYVIGRRAHAYFALGPEAMDDVQSSFRAITGLDERKLKGWLRDAAGRLRPGRRPHFPSPEDQSKD